MCNCITLFLGFIHFYSCVWVFACLYICAPCECLMPPRPEHDIGSPSIVGYRCSVAALWVLGIQLGPFGKATNTLNCWAIFSALSLYFFPFKDVIMHWVFSFGPIFPLLASFRCRGDVTHITLLFFLLPGLRKRPLLSHRTGGKSDSLAK